MPNRYSQTALFICCGIIWLAGIFYYPKWKLTATEATISWDVSGYYLYLPATFIYHGMHQLGFADSIVLRYKPTPDIQQAYRHSSGSFVMKYTMGQAVLYSPFFFIAHIYASFGNSPADGFSYPYQLGLGLGMLLYVCIGLLFLRKVLLFFFSDEVVAITIIVIAFATNYFNYAAIDGAMVHNTLFMLYSTLLYATISFYKKPGMNMAVFIGIITGLITLIRLTECICLLLPLLWGITDAGSLRNWLFLLRKNALYYTTAVMVFVVVIFCQLLYWKWASGEWFVYTYRNEGFDWLHPQIVKGFFSYKNGWLVYTPLMFLVFPGFVFLYRKHRSLFCNTAVFSCLFIYICFSWKEWWYGAGVGQRAMIQSYPVLSFPLAAFVAGIYPLKMLRYILIPVIGVAVYYNLWLTHQAHKGGLLVAGEMNKPYFHAILGRYSVPPETFGLLDNEEQIIGDTSIPFSVIPLPVQSAGLDTKRELAAEYFFSIPAHAIRIRAEFKITTPRKEWDVWKMPQAVIRFYKGEKVVKTSFVRVNRQFSEGETGIIYVDAILPPAYDKAAVLAWNAGSDKPVLIHGIQIKVY